MRRVSEDALDADNDWTADPQTGRSNSSPLFLELVTEVERIIRSGADTIVSGRADTIVESHRGAASPRSRDAATPGPGA